VNYRAVLFDFDGVILDTEWAIYQAWLRTFQAHGHDLPLELYTRCIGSDFETWSPKTHLEELTGRAFDWHDLDLTRQGEIMSDLSGERVMPGILSLIENLQRWKVRLAVVSSSSHSWVDTWLEKLELIPYFETIVCRGDAPRIKPEPDLYLEAVKRLGLPPEQCLVIEDSLNGAKAARAAGLEVWVVPNRVTAGSDFSIATKVFPTIAVLSDEF
jgi:HAD superfamily hydrolase (TIGR01509 family)